MLRGRLDSRHRRDGSQLGQEKGTLLVSGRRLHLPEHERCRAGESGGSVGLRIPLAARDWQMGLGPLLLRPPETEYRAPLHPPARMRRSSPMKAALLLAVAISLCA